MAEDDVDRQGAAEAKAESIADARHAIEETRGRISARLDAIEDRVERKKEQLKERVDVLRPVRDRIREQPWQALALAAGAGFIVGLLAARAGGEAPPGRAGRRPRRAGELEASRSRRAPRHARRRRVDAADDAEESSGLFRELRGQLLGTLARAVSEGLADRARRAAAR